MIFTKRKLTTISFILALFFVSTAEVCDRAKDAKRAAVSANAIQTTINIAVDETAQLYHDKILSKERTHTIAKGLEKANNANQILINTARAMNSDSSTNRCLLANSLLNVANAVKDLQEMNLLGIKSKNGKLVFDTTISSLIASIKILAEIIGPCAESVEKVVAKLEENHEIFKYTYTN